MAKNEIVRTDSEEIENDSIDLAWRLRYAANKAYLETINRSQFRKLKPEDPAVLTTRDKIIKSKHKRDMMSSEINDLLRKYDRHVIVNGPAGQFDGADSELISDVNHPDLGPIVTVQGVVNSIDYDRLTLNLTASNVGSVAITYGRFVAIPGITDPEAISTVDISFPEEYRR